MLNFLELKTQTAKLAQRADDSNYVTLIGQWVNTSVDFLSKIYDYWAELEAIHNFTTVASTESYYMPQKFDKPLRIKDLTNTKDLVVKTEQEYVDGYLSSIVNSTTVTAPLIARFYGMSPVTKQISTSGGIVKAQSSTTEASSRTIRVSGYIDSARTVIGYENLTVTSTSYATGTVTFYELLYVSKDSDTTGTITLANSSNETLVTMSTVDRVMRFKVLKLGQIPSGANSMRIWYKRGIDRMVNDYDYPFVEADDFILLNSLGYCYMQEKETMERASIAWQKAEAVLLNQLKNVQGRLGDSYQHKIISSLMQSHRS